jgi:hypothetical protein
MARSTPRAASKADSTMPSPGQPATHASSKPATPRAKASAQAVTPRAKSPRTRQKQSLTASRALPTAPVAASTTSPEQPHQQPVANHFLTCLACSVFGSIAGCVGKFALDSGYTVPIAAAVTRGYSEQHAFVFYIVRALLVGCMLFLNSIMLNFLVRAMKALGTAPATTIINGFSFCFSVRIQCAISRESFQVFSLIRRVFVKINPTGHSRKAYFWRSHRSAVVVWRARHSEWRGAHDTRFRSRLFTLD